MVTKEEKDAEAKAKESELAAPNARNATVLKTVAETLTSVASSFHAQAAKEGADPKVLEALDTAKAQLEAIKPLP